jgi:NhaP-type Na+/H+ or K+/H+ antiporter
VHTETAFVLTIFVLCYAMVSGLIRRWYLAPALIFVVVGAIVGRFGIGLVNVGEHTAAFTVLAQLALTVILFNQASMLDLRALLRARRVPLRLLAIGIPVTVAFGTATAVVLLPLLPFLGGRVPGGDRGAHRSRIDRCPSRRPPHSRAGEARAFGRKRLL